MQHSHAQAQPEHAPPPLQQAQLHPVQHPGGQQEADTEGADCVGMPQEERNTIKDEARNVVIVKPFDEIWFRTEMNTASRTRCHRRASTGVTLARNDSARCVQFSQTPSEA